MAMPSITALLTESRGAVDFCILSAGHIEYRPVTHALLELATPDLLRARRPALLRARVLDALFYKIPLNAALECSVPMDLMANVCIGVADNSHR